MKTWDWQDDECIRALWDALYTGKSCGGIKEELQTKFANAPQHAAISFRINKRTVRPDFIRIGIAPGIVDSVIRSYRERYARHKQKPVIRPVADGDEGLGLIEPPRSHFLCAGITGDCPNNRTRGKYCDECAKVMLGSPETKAKKDRIAHIEAGTGRRRW